MFSLLVGFLYSCADTGWMIAILEPLFSWVPSLTLKPSGVTYIQCLGIFFPAILILCHQSVNNSCMFSFISRNVWNSHTYLVFFVERVFYLVSCNFSSFIHLA